MLFKSLFIAGWLLLCPLLVAADQITVAVASNFSPTLQRLAERFEAQTGHRVRLSAASTGKLYAQISHGAPFDILLAADAEHPRRLETEGLSVPGSRFTYARGRLALWSPTIVSDLSAQALLTSPRVNHIAMANPRTAPYGAAAKQWLVQAGLWDRLQDRLIRGENVGQSYQYVASGAAPIGFVAYSQVLRGKHSGGYLWLIPEEGSPIRQQAVLLKRAETSVAALALMDYLRSPQAQQIISEQGYGREITHD